MAVSIKGINIFRYSVRARADQFRVRVVFHPLIIWCIMFEKHFPLYTLFKRDCKNARQYRYTHYLVNCKNTPETVTFQITGAYRTHM